MSNLIGTGGDLLSSKLPTLRDVLRYGLLLREQSDEDVKNYPEVLQKWQQANNCFVAPVMN